MSGMERLGLVAGLTVVYALFCLWCARRHHRQRLAGATLSDTLVAYASQTGTAMELAKRTVRALNGQARLLPLNLVDEKVLSSARRALIVASTYGQGEPPDNGVRFARRCLKSDADFSHLEFAVLALGDRSYPDFCNFGRTIHCRLSELGATPLCDIIEVDAQDLEGSEAQVARWHTQLRPTEEKFPGDFGPTAGHGWVQWQLTERVVLNPGSVGQPLFHLKLVASTCTQPRWQPGDIVDFIPPAGSDALPQGSHIAPRKYSIASIASDGTLDLVVRQQRNDTGELGLASGWLTERVAIGEYVDLRLCDNAMFRPPASDVPLILIGNGSGIAGLRAHLRHRQQEGEGSNWLIFGERDPEVDNIFAEELEEWQRCGHLDALHLTFSRCVERPMYVQDCLKACEAQVREWVHAGAVIMVCGSREGMAQGVDRVLEDILGRKALDELEADDRYRRDVY